MTTDPDKADLFFEAYQKNAKQGDEAFEACKRIHSAPKKVVTYHALLNTLWEVLQVPPKDAAANMGRGLSLLSHKLGCGVELEPFSCAAAGVDPQVLAGRIRASLGGRDISIIKVARSKQSMAARASRPAAGLKPNRRSQTKTREGKGDLALLTGPEGKLKRAVNLDTACRFGGVGSRAIEKAIKKGSLQAEGDRQNRRVLVSSLLQYFPPEDNAN
jgi:hypothetical protein